LGDPTIFNLVIRDSHDKKFNNYSFYGITIENINVENLNGGIGALLNTSFERNSSYLNISNSNFTSIISSGGIIALSYAKNTSIIINNSNFSTISCYGNGGIINIISGENSSVPKIQLMNSNFSSFIPY
jgi:hypothetical protein